MSQVEYTGADETELQKLTLMCGSSMILGYGDFDESSEDSEADVDLEADIELYPNAHVNINGNLEDTNPYDITNINVEMVVDADTHADINAATHAATHADDNSYSIIGGKQPKQNPIQPIKNKQTRLNKFDIKKSETVFNNQKLYDLFGIEKSLKAHTTNIGGANNAKYSIINEVNVVNDNKTEDFEKMFKYAKNMLKNTSSKNKAHTDRDSIDKHIISECERYFAYEDLRKQYIAICAKHRITPIGLSIDRLISTMRLVCNETSQDPIFPTITTDDKFLPPFYYEHLAICSKSVCDTIYKSVKDLIDEKIYIIAQAKKNYRPVIEVKRKTVNYVITCKISENRMITHTLSFSHYKKLQDMFAREMAHEQVSDNIDTPTDANADVDSDADSDVDSDSKDAFHDRLFILLTRYTTIGGYGYQLAIPKPMFAALLDLDIPTHECFASPLNCTLESYTSAFPDTDRYFGSAGSFFNHPITPGIYECNPPFIELHMQLVAFRAQEALDIHERANLPLSFLIIMSNWEDAEYYKILSNSKYKISHEILERYSHKYINGESWRGIHNGNSSMVMDMNASISINANTSANMSTPNYFIAKAQSVMFLLQTTQGAKQHAIVANNLLELFKR